ncbi:MAG: carbon-nitrogen hydrolase family protein [Lentisphaeria bacterium]|nr:carbon-nitrogen hydrolase family protein [Lentisphaeria bacterium]
MKIYQEIFDDHASMLLARSKKARQEISTSLEEDSALPLTVAAFQMKNSCGGEEQKKQNLVRMLSAIDLAAEKGVQILTFPEMCLSGYFTPTAGSAQEGKLANLELADIVTESSYLQALQEKALSTQMVLTFGFAEKLADVIYNSIGVIDADGSWLGTRRKAPLYPWAYENESFEEPGTEDRSVVFQTKYATIGVSNCFDGEFPESIRRMRFAGAEILLWSNAALGNSKLGSSHRINHSGAHAQANNMWVVCCNCAAENSSGTSLIVSNSGEPLVILPPNEEALALAIGNPGSLE